MSLNKVSKEKDELGNSKSQLKHHKNDLKDSLPAVKEILISYSHRAEIAEGQT